MKFCTCIVIALAAVCNAVDLYVPSQYATIQAAINSAQSGDAVIIADGLWAGAGNNDLTISGKDITLKSENGPDNCIITGPVSPSATSMLAISNCGNMTLEGITFQNSDIRAVFANVASSFVVRNCNFNNIVAPNSSAMVGAIRFLGAGEITVEGCSFSDNISGASYTCLYISSASKATIDNCSFTANTSFQAAGGAVNLTNITNGATITNSSFVNNTALTREGGAVYSDNYGLDTSQLNISNCYFEGNTGTIGGAVWTNTESSFYAEKHSTITNCLFKNNKATTGRGGGLYAGAIISKIDGCTFDSNEAATFGGGMHIGSGTRISSLGQVEITNNVFASNIAEYSAAFNSDLQPSSIKRNLIIRNCDIYDNRSPNQCLGFYLYSDISACRIFENKVRVVLSFGGSTYTPETYPLLRNCLIYRNVRYDYNAMTAIGFAENLIIKNCTIADNEGKAFVRDYPSGYFEITNSIIYNNGGTGNNYAIADLKDGAIIKNSCIDSYQGTNIQASGVITVDPQLMAGGRLGAGSPCIDAGLNSEAGDFDLDGKPRIIGDAVDMGAYEFSIRPDIDYSGTVDMGDVSQLAANWNLAQPDIAADVNDDGIIDILDINAIAADWLVDIANMPINHLQCHYKFDETIQMAAAEISINCIDPETPGLTAIDSSPCGRDAAVYNPTGFWAAGQGVSGGCAFIGGTTRYITIQNYRGIVGEGSRTVCFWMKTSDNDGMLFSWGTSAAPRQKWLLRISPVTNSQNQTGGALRLEIGSGNVVSDTIINDSQWHHIAVVFDREQSPYVSSAKIYIDGVVSPVLSFADNTVDTFGANFVQIGAFTYASLYGADAYIDDFRIYSKALSHQEITDIQQSQGQ